MALDGIIKRRYLCFIKTRWSKMMGNKFGNFATSELAHDAIIAEGYRQSQAGSSYTKKSVTGGSLVEEPRNITSIVEITSYRVDGKWASDGRDYLVYQHHFVS